MKILGNIDDPHNNQIIGNVFNIKGWAYSNSDNDITVNIYIDGNLVKSGLCEFPRYDIYQKYLTEDAYLSGYMGRIRIDDLDKGEHEIRVTDEN